MKLLIKVGQLVLQVIYQLLKIFPVKDKIVLISRQNNNPSIDFLMLKEEIKQEMPQVKVVFLCKTLDGGVDSSIVKKVSYFLHMFHQMFHLATSKVVVLDTYCIVVSLLKHRKSLKVIQMWHSMGTMKLFGYTAVDNTEGSSSYIAELMHMHENYDYFIAASDNYKNHLARGFKCDEKKAFICPLPRYDLLKSQKYKEKKRKEIYSVYPELENKKIVLYCPTFRKNENQMKKALESLINNLPGGFILVVKLHPLSKIIVDESKAYTVREFSTFDMLFVADYVISDYSCVVYEAGILGLPLCFYTFDLDDYKQNRGFALDYEKEMPGVVSCNPYAIMNAIEENRINIDEVIEFTDKYIERTENATKKLAEFVLSVGRMNRE